MEIIGSRCLVLVLAILTVLMTKTVDAQDSPAEKRPPHIGPKGCPLVPAPPPPPQSPQLSKLVPTEFPRVCELDQDCPGRQICCPTGACCGTYCYDPFPFHTNKPIYFPER
ncbi:uncharacterized protein [Macrobrachium rosenbergii]|uniref:uncharacterized protein n=1 Tax=Macrobrachium rosenbergii TaxID=79674 RepID=UPI0034D3A2FE